MNFVFIQTVSYHTLQSKNCRSTTAFINRTSSTGLSTGLCFRGEQSVHTARLMQQSRYLLHSHGDSTVLHWRPGQSVEDRHMRSEVHERQWDWWGNKCKKKKRVSVFKLQMFWMEKLWHIWACGWSTAMQCSSGKKKTKKNNEKKRSYLISSSYNKYK